MKIARGSYQHVASYLETLVSRALPFAGMALPVLLLLVGCHYVSQTEIVTQAQYQTGPVSLALVPCTDRTGTRTRDVAADATEALERAIAGSNEFVLGVAGRYRLNCDVSEYMPGNAVQRWILPGWGQTVGKISAMLTDTSTGATVALITGEARVAAGGLYTIGADTYIVDAAATDIARQLREWAHGVATGGPAASPQATSRQPSTGPTRSENGAAR
jgi:hypothetical protein